MAQLWQIEEVANGDRPLIWGSFFPTATEKSSRQKTVLGSLLHILQEREQGSSQLWNEVVFWSGFYFGAQNMGEGGVYIVSVEKPSTPSSERQVH